MIKRSLLCAALGITLLQVPTRLPASEAGAAAESSGPVELVKVVGEMGARTLDATVGELLVRAYPSHSLLDARFDAIPARLELSCDTYRSGVANKWVAAATACHVGFEFTLSSGGYTLSGPFRPSEDFRGSSCEQARQFCRDYQVRVIESADRALQLFSAETPLGVFRFDKVTPSYEPVGAD